MFIEFADRFGQRPATAIRLAGLAALIFWQTRVSDPAGFHGRHLVILILLIGASITWLTWALGGTDHPGARRGLSWELFLMAACGGAMLGPSPEGPANVFVFVAAFSAGARVALPRAFLVTGLAIVAVCVTWVLYDVGGLGDLAYSLGLIATTFGGAQRHDGLVRREQAELLLAQTQRSHEEALRNAKLQEQSRIAREIHDVLAHSLAGLTIQLEATAALIEGGADAQTVLPRVKRAYELARDGLRETRLAVGALRGEDAQAVPSASRIEAIIADFRATGGDVTLDIDAARAELGGEAGGAAVRIIQEALTNVTKHSPGASVSVRVTPGPPLALTVQSRVPAGVSLPHATLSDSGGGYGIAGMRERAEELGGSLVAGPTPDGWLVNAVLASEELDEIDTEVDDAA